MTTLFFFGSLRDRALLEIVLDRAVDDGDIQPATAQGFETLAFEEEAYPYLAPSTEANAPGILVQNITNQDLARLEFFEETEYGVAPITVETSAGPVEAQYFRSTDILSATDRPWDFDAWLRDEAAVAREAAIELMAHFGKITMDEIDRIWGGIMIRARMRAVARAHTPATGPLRKPRAADDVVTEELRRPYTSYFAIEEHRLRHRRFDGSLTPPIERIVLSSGDAVTVLPYDPKSGRVMLIEQFRAAMHARGDACPWSVEVIAGRLDQELDPEACARREAEEEGGLILGRLEQISQYYTSPGVIAEHITAYVGEADLEGTGGVFGLAEENEDIRAFVVPLEAAMAGVASGEINNGPAVLSLLWLDRNCARLREAWAK